MIQSVPTRTKRLVSGRDRGVSPVIGVIVMVGITVIMAAVIGAFVFSLGGDQAQPPTARLDFSVSEQQVVIRHGSGDSLPVATVDVVVDGSSVGSGALEPGGSDGTYTAGEAVYSGAVDSGAEILVVWHSPTSDRTTTLAHTTIP